MKRFQIVQKPIATATGERPRWKMWAHGATMTEPDANALIARHKELGYISRKLPI